MSNIINLCGNNINEIIEHELQLFRGLLDMISNIVSCNKNSDSCTKNSEIDALLRAQKIETASVVLSGIAHEFNNILMILNGNLELAMIEEDITDDTQDLYNEMKKGIDRAAVLVNSMRSVSKCRKGNKQDRKLLDLLSMALKKCNKNPNAIHEININVSDNNNKTVNINPVAFIQALVNIIENAIQAQPKGGVINISVDCKPIENNTEKIFITISDNGPGILSENENQIFDAYYSSKQGYLGLGLTASQWIINNHFGDITYLGSGSDKSPSGLNGAHFLITL